MTETKRLTVRDIDPGRLDYTTEDVARLFGKNVEVSRRWTRMRKLTPLPQPGTYRFAGSELLRLASTTGPVVRETATERRRRGQAAKEEALAVA